MKKEPHARGTNGASGGQPEEGHNEAFMGHIFHRRNELAEKTVSDPKVVQHWEMVHVFCSISIIDVYVGYLVKR